MIPKKSMAALVAVTLVVFTSCSDDRIAGSQRGDGTIVDGTVDEGMGSFEYVVESAGDPSDPIQGPFVIRGSNIFYSDLVGGLGVDLTVRNEGTVSHPEPVGLTFHKFIPEGSGIANPDNGVHGVGAYIRFHFANDDAQWAPGEESLPRTVFLWARRGQSRGFSAGIEIGEDPRGTIAGLVWHDADRSGTHEPNEPGIAGVEIYATRSSGPEVGPPEILYHAVTGPDGKYAIMGLPAGFYTISKPPGPHWLPTTPSVIHVVLPENVGGLGDFLQGDFGCVPQDSIPPDSLAVR